MRREISSKLYSNFNYIRVRTFILNGAPNFHRSEQNCEPPLIVRIRRCYASKLKKSVIDDLLHDEKRSGLPNAR
jgi:hypothetical protein